MLQGHFGSQGLNLKKLVRGLLVQASDQSGSEEEDLLIFYFVLWFQPGISWHCGHLGNFDLHLNKLGKRPLGTATC